MCSGNAFVPPRDWNHELHNLVGCDHVSIMARRLDAFLEDFMLAHHYNRRANDEPLKPVTFFDVTRRMREDAAKEPRGETILLNRVPIDLESDKFTETDGTDGKTAADCFAKGGYLTGQPQTTFGGIPVAPPIDLPPVEVKPRVRGLASLRRSWRVR